MFQNNLKENNDKTLLDQSYKQIPMDVNSSPLEEYFREILSKKNDTNTMTTPAASAKPVSIPGTLTTKIHENKHYLAHTFPFMNDVQYQQQNTRQKLHATTPKFIVGSLVEEKPPVPWPVSLLTTKPHDTTTTKYRHLKNVRNENWPSAYHEPIDNESDVFSMDEDIEYNDSDFDNDIDIDENDI